MPRYTSAALPFERKLALNQWLLGVLGVTEFAELQGWIKDPEFEGFDTENISNFFHALSVRLINRSELTRDDLLRYDTNIVRHWQQITERRNLAEGRPLLPKYFQYLALLSTEIYLDRYFNDQEGLLADINKAIDAHNRDKAIRDQVETFKREELNKLAFWMATGSGKTLLMHCNLLQYQHYLKAASLEASINRMLLLTPNEGLSLQHLREFEQSNIPASLFSKQAFSGLFSESGVEIIDIHKLSDEHGDKTIDVAAFEQNNLVLVDEGHSGASGTTWMRRREILCENGFSFEYSATFGQAIKKDNKLTQTYAKSILFDYSYRYFYKDGYGKEYRILNLEDDSDEEHRYRYLSACLLAFYQQQRVYQQEERHFRDFLIEKPLWVFVGGSVKAVYQRNRRQVSDVLDVLLFLAEFAAPESRERNLHVIQSFLDGHAGLLDSQGRDIFENSFHYLVTSGMDAEEVYQDILRTLFHAASPAKLHVELLKGSEGEIGLRLGNNSYFGLINIGDAPAFSKLAEAYSELVITELPVSSSIFHQLDAQDSGINILIGSRKFMEGWNSWRVSTMGLMNIGRGEGTQIIQLFGRGVRLKGKEYSLKRSGALDEFSSPEYVPTLETLNIFGVRADYMRQFREYLEVEGIPTEAEKMEFVLPVVKNLGTRRLKTLRLKRGADYKRQAPYPALDLPNAELKRNPVVVNWYPRIQALSSNVIEADTSHLDRVSFTEEHVAFLDVDQLYFDLEQLKAERGWHNLRIRLGVIEQLLLDSSWYVLYIPQEELAFQNLAQVQRWQEIASGLLKKYCDHYYKYYQAKWESEHLEYQELTEEDPNFFPEYHILYEKSRQDICIKLEEIKLAVESGSLRTVEYQRLKAFMFDQHLYKPLLYLGKNQAIEIKPVALNDGEKEFVEDLIAYWDRQHGAPTDKELYLLRNRSRGHGVGFFEAGNFYPDFIMWLVDGDTQHVTFVDPKGIHNIGIGDPKIMFYETIKSLEAKLGDPEVKLNSFIVSNTPFSDLPIQLQEMSRHDWESRHVFFQTDDKAGYIGKIFARLLLPDSPKG